MHLGNSACDFHLVKHYEKNWWLVLKYQETKTKRVWDWDRIVTVNNKAEGRQRKVKNVARIIDLKYSLVQINIKDWSVS